VPGARHRYGLVEVYDRKRFFTVTGQPFSPSVQPVRDCTAALAWLTERFEAVRRADAASPVSPALPAQAPAPGAEDWQRIQITLVDPPTPDFFKFQALLDSSPKFRKSWQRQHPGTFTGDSPSEYDLSLASLAAYAGWTDQEICTLLRAWRMTHSITDKLHRLDYYQRTIFTVRNTMDYQQATQQLTPALLSSMDTTGVKQVIAQLTGLAIEHYIQIGYNPAVYRMVLVSGKDIVVGTAQQARSQQRWLDLAMEHTGGKPFRQMSAAQWQAFLVALSHLLTTEDPTENLTVATFEEAVVLYTGNVPDRSPTADTLQQNAPFVYNGCCYLHIGAFLQWLQIHRHPLATQITIQALIRASGFRRITVHRDFPAPQGGARAKGVSRSYWTRPLRPCLPVDPPDVSPDDPPG